MRIYMDNNTGNICLLTYINSDTMIFNMEYEWGDMKATVNKKIHTDINEAIDAEYTEVGSL